MMNHLFFCFPNIRHNCRLSDQVSDYSAFKTKDECQIQMLRTLLIYLSIDFCPLNKLSLLNTWMPYCSRFRLVLDAFITWLYGTPFKARISALNMYVRYFIKQFKAISIMKYCRMLQKLWIRICLSNVDEVDTFLLKNVKFFEIE